MSLKDNAKGCGVRSVTLNQPKHMVTPVRGCDVTVQKRRVPFMVQWQQCHVPYPPGSLVIHDAAYWVTFKVEYAPPGQPHTSWEAFDLERWLEVSQKLIESQDSFLSFPVYERPLEACGIPVKLNGSTISAVPERESIKVFQQDEVVAANGLLYYALRDNVCTYPPSPEWGGGVSLNDLILRLLKQ